MSEPINKIVEYLKRLLKELPKFTGKVELNFKDGVVKDGHETRRTKFEEGN